MPNMQKPGNHQLSARKIYGTSSAFSAFFPGTLKGFVHQLNKFKYCFIPAPELQICLEFTSICNQKPRHFTSHLNRRAPDLCPLSARAPSGTLSTPCPRIIGVSFAFSMGIRAPQCKNEAGPLARKCTTVSLVNVSCWTSWARTLMKWSFIEFARLISQLFPICFQLWALGPMIFHFFPQQRKLMGSSAQISSGVCRCGSQEQVPEESSGRFRRVPV